MIILRWWLRRMAPVMVLLILRAEPVAWGVSVDSFRAPHFIIVQDVSRSAATQADAISVDKALCEFLKSNAAYFRGSSMQLIRFGRDVELVADHTVIGIEDVSAIVHALQQAQRSDFWTETMSALAMALQNAAAVIQHDPNSQVLIIFLGDGLFDPSPLSESSLTLDDLSKIVEGSQLRPGENLYFWSFWSGDIDEPIRAFSQAVLGGRSKTAADLDLPVIWGASAIPEADVCIGTVEWSAAWKLASKNTGVLEVEFVEPKWSPALPPAAELTIEVARTRLSGREDTDFLSVPVRLHGSLPAPYSGTVSFTVRTPGVLSVCSEENFAIHVEAKSGMMVLERSDGESPLQLFVGEDSTAADLRLTPSDSTVPCGNARFSSKVILAPATNGITVEVEPVELVFDRKVLGDLEFRVKARASRAALSQGTPRTVLAHVDVRSLEPSISVKPSRLTIPLELRRSVLHVSASGRLAFSGFSTLVGEVNVSLHGKGIAGSAAVQLELTRGTDWPEDMMANLEPQQLTSTAGVRGQTVRLTIQNVPRGFESSVRIVPTTAEKAIRLHTDESLELGFAAPTFRFWELIALIVVAGSLASVPAFLLLKFVRQPDPEGALEVVSGPSRTLSYTLRRFRSFWHRNIIRVGASSDADLQISGGSLGPLHFEVITESRSPRNTIVRVHALEGHQLTLNNELTNSGRIYDSDLLGAGDCVFRFRSMRALREGL